MSKRMKKCFSRIGSAMVSVVMGLALIPNIAGAPVVRANYFPKTQYNSNLGVKGIRSPLKPTGKDEAWKGDYVWFGYYNSSPIKFRVLSPGTDAYGGNTMLLDSDKVLFNAAFDDTTPYSCAWEGSSIQQVLNGDFLKKFSDIEKASIVTSQVDGGKPYAAGSLEEHFAGATVGLNDKVFLLDTWEILNPSYGYSADFGVDDGWTQGYYVFHKVNNHLKGTGKYLLRADCIRLHEAVLDIWTDGGVGSANVSELQGIAPAMNIDLDSILLNSCVVEKSGYGSEYKLTLLDKDMGITLTEGALIERTDTRKFSIPYTLTGKHASSANCVRVLILDKEYQPQNANNAKILYYDEIDAYLSGTSGTATLELPSFVNVEAWGESYHVYILAEEVDATVNGEHSSDYASVPVEIPAPWRSIVVDVSNGVSEELTDDEANAVLALMYNNICKYSGTTKYVYLDLDSNGNDDIMIYLNTTSKLLYKSGDTNLTGTYTFTRDQLKDTIYGEITFVFDRTLTISFDANGGSGTMEPIAAFVGETIVLPECAFTAPAGMTFWRWSMGAPGDSFKASTNDVITAMWTPIMYSVSVTSDGNGAASASATSGPMGMQVTLYATPNAGYRLKEWQVISGGVTITGDTFTIGTSDVLVKAIFEVAPVQPDPVVPQPQKDPTFEDFIERMYVVALNRQSEPEGKAFWMNKVKNEGFTGGRVAIGFLIEAPEFLNRNLSDSDFIDVLYKTFFDREADEGGKAFWMGHLATDMTREQVVRGFIDSTEWCNLCAYYGVKSGAPNAKANDPSVNAMKFAMRLYTECLGRDPDADGLMFWALRLTNLESSGYEAARGFFESQEFRNLNVDDETYVKLLYRTFMGRDYDQGGLEFWLGHLSTDMNRLQVLQGFAQSQEFTNICNEYGIDRGTI